MRITDETLTEIIEHGGALKHWPLNQEGTLKLALDLHDARARITELEELLEDPNLEHTG